ncbi:MAG: efflux RND transporter permease subunit [Bacillota bacterium]
MSLPDRVIKRPVTTLTMVCLVMIIGLVSLWKAPLDLLPDIKPPLIAVITVFPGSSPRETLNLVTEPIEQQVSAIGGLTNLSSFSQENLSLVVLKFHWGSELNSLRDEVSARLDLLSLPDGARRPIILKFDPTLLPVLQVAASGSDHPVELTSWLNSVVKPSLEQIQGVASVEVQGGAVQDLFIKLDPALINDARISFEQVANILRASVLDMPAGVTELDDTRLRLRFLGRPGEIDQLRKLVVGFRVDEAALHELVGRAVDLDLNKRFSAALPSFNTAEIPMQTICLRDLTAQVRINEAKNVLAITLDRTALEQWGLNPKQLLLLMPRRWNAALVDQIIEIPLPPGTCFHWKNITDMPLIRLPDLEVWLGQLQAQAGAELAEASRQIEQSLTAMAETMILASANPGGTAAFMGDDLAIEPVYLGAIADIKVDLHDPSTITRINGQPSISLVVQKEGAANTVAVSRQVRQVLKDISGSSDGKSRGIHFISTFDQAREIENALSDVAWALIGGSTLAVGILLAFLKDWRTVAVIGLSIPIAVIATFSLLYFSNLTINLMTLGALALAAGMLVDNAIIVSENIYRLFQAGLEPHAAAVSGSKEVAGAITASTLTTISVFFPVVFLSGLAGELFKDFALTVSCALIASLIIALTVIPLLASRFLRPGDTRRILIRQAPLYRRILERVIQRPWATVALGAAFVALGILLYPLLGMNLFPSPEGTSFFIDINLPAGTTLRHTEAYVAAVEQTLIGLEGVNFYTSRIGETQFFGLPFDGGLTNQARIRVHTDPRRGEPIGTIMEQARRRVALIEGEALVGFTRESLLDSVGLETKLELIVEGESMNQVSKIAAELAARLHDTTSMNDVQSVLDETRPEVHAHMDHCLALQKGVTVFQVATVLRQAMEGMPVARLETEEMGILNLILGYRKSELASLEDLKNIGFYTASGAFLKLGEVAEFTRGQGPTSIPRENQRVVGIVQAQYQGDLGAAAREAMQVVEEMALPPGYTVRTTGTASLMGDVFSELELVLVLAALLIYLVMAAQFESLLHPLIIICSLPLAYTGSILSLLLTGNTLSVPALIGAVVLSGVLVNDGIIMVDFINQQRRLYGLPLQNAIIEGAAARLRPILMTTITTILGLVPLALGLGEGSQLQAPMALVIIGGQVTGTVLLLAVIPAVYRLTNKD